VDNLYKKKIVLEQEVYLDFFKNI